MKLYPLKFNPILKEKMWGGTKLTSQFNKESSSEFLGESWEISDVEGDVSMVSNGDYSGTDLSELVQQFGAELVGNSNFERFGTDFPLLIKFIDAKQDLSIQVHPNDQLAKERHNSFGKTEMWYVMEAEKDARLVVGFNEEINKETYVQLLENKNIMSVMNEVPVQPGDTFFIETGTVHAIGAGTVIAEIQQTSDITYRIYDFDRVDQTTGTTRELHTELAVDALNYSKAGETKAVYESRVNELVETVSCPYFKTNILELKGAMNLDYSSTDSFVIFMCVEGNATIEVEGNSEELKMGETVLIPAEATSVNLSAENAKLLEVTV